MYASAFYFSYVMCILVIGPGVFGMGFVRQWLAWRVLGAQHLRVQERKRHAMSIHAMSIRMCLHTCLHACPCTCLCTCPHTCPCTCLHACLYGCECWDVMSAHMSTHIYTRVCTHSYGHVCKRDTWLRTCPDIRLRTFLSIYLHTGLHTRVCAHDTCLHTCPHTRTYTCECRNASARRSWYM